MSFPSFTFSDSLSLLGGVVSLYEAEMPAGIEPLHYSFVLVWFVCLWGFGLLI